MHYKIQGAIRRNKNRFIIFFVLWLFMAIVLIAPIAYSQEKATVDGVFDFGKCVTEIGGAYSNLGEIMRNIWDICKGIF